ncbi:putative ATP-binding protein involved in virulence/5-methylcytosine-specific restriction endonuclease McrA [Pseudomonas chlororaphis]|uniref:AAA family ATPase n=1 Tax=Pseudomonas chlororaphis TaxID=587753 RepID=UPI0020A12F16|nr:AAA family ATPase [Pseudomonas chlororaphis]MCP1478641.1 putative ATP-binding protein involved in virulence/5-methylcytosine-specific restriction endonuclease McrA [Pseudomonas chlororaphis]MCP1595007.1 putative ATP-binding protein involved in virulence/5-methylcytosine-specific restriction endonuclease McrA [Pseudomonas chlororaphis]
MIRYNLGPEPAFFSTREAHKTYKDATAYFSRSTKGGFVSRPDIQRFTALFVHAAEERWLQQGVNKCVYCEQLSSNLVVDHFRPKLAYLEPDETNEDAPYWWLAFQWRNFLPACVECNNLKGQKFPVYGRRLQFNGPEVEEDAQLLNPAEDDLTDRFVFLEDGRIAGLDGKARITIDVIGLNRPSLVSLRKDEWSKLHSLVSAITKRNLTAAQLRLIEAQCGETYPFSAMRRQLFNSWVALQSENDPGFLKKLQRALGGADFDETSTSSYSAGDMNKISDELDRQTQEFESFSIEEAKPPVQLYQRTQYIERVEVSNIRTIKKLDAALKPSSDSVGSWFMFLGENGTGKSTLLQVIAAALIGQSGVDELGITADSLLKSDADSGTVLIYLTGLSRPITLSLDRKSNSVNVDPPEPKVMVLAYGSIRVFDEQLHEESSFRARSKVRNLFNHWHTLDAGNPWLNQAQDHEFENIANALTSLLPRPDGARIIRKNGEVLVESPNDIGGLSSISSGYRAIISLALDIIGILRRGGWSDISQAEAIVLIDEIDAHLHPRWKMKIVQRLREVFPRIQFIATSHDPLTLKGLDANEIAVLSRTIDGDVLMLDLSDEALPSPRHMRVDQILSSEYFGLNSTEDLEMDQAFEDYYKLLGKPERTVNEEAKLTELKQHLGTSRKFGVTAREQLVFEAADQYIASRKYQRDSMPDGEKEASLKKMQELWARLPTGDAEGDGPEGANND